MTDIDETIERDNVQHRAEDHDSNPSSRHGGQDQASAKADKADGDWGRKEKHRSKEQDGEEANSKKDEGEGEGEDKKKKSKLPILIGVVALALLIAAVCAYFFLTRNTESTDDAYTEGDAVGIAPHIPGYVIERLVDDNQFVRAGQLMLRIDPRDYITARDQARANLDLAIAQERSAELDLEIARVKYPSERQQSQAQLDRMRLGQSVTISVDAFPKMKVRGHIDTFQQGAGARFTTFPSENATGNFVKIVRRLPVKIIIDSGIDPQQGLPLGLSVTPTVALQ